MSNLGVFTYINQTIDQLILLQKTGNKVKQLFDKIYQLEMLIG